MTIDLEPTVLRKVSSDLYQLDLAVAADSAVPAPDTGATAGLAAEAVRGLTDGAELLADALRALAGGVDDTITDFLDVDGQVSVFFDLLHQRRAS